MSHVPVIRAGFDAWDRRGLMVVFGDGYRVCEESAGDLGQYYSLIVNSLQSS